MGKDKASEDRQELLGPEDADAAAGKKAKEKHKKDKKDDKGKVTAKHKSEFSDTTADAALLSASRLAHVFEGELKPDDALGYLYHIALHFVSTAFSFFFAYQWFIFLENIEDPLETSSINLMEEELQRAMINDSLPLSNYTYTGWTNWSLPPINTTGQTNWTEWDEIKASYTLGHCIAIRHDLFYPHMALLGIFCALIVDMLLKLAHRLYVIIALPAQSHFKWEGYETLDEKHNEDEEKEPEKMHYSMRNWNPDDNDVDHMRIPLKIISIVLIIIPDLLFTLVAFWTGAKLFATRMGNPVKLIKSALKVSFLLKFPSQYYEFFASYNMKVYGRGGEFWIPNTVDEEKEEEDKKKEEEEDPNPTWHDYWGAWGSSVFKIVAGYALAAILMLSVWGQVYEFRNKCKAYESWLKVGPANDVGGWGWGKGIDSYWASEGWPDVLRNSITSENILSTLLWVPPAPAV